MTAHPSWCVCEDCKRKPIGGTPPEPSGPSRLPQTEAHGFIADSTGKFCAACGGHECSPLHAAGGPSRLRALLQAHFDIKEASPLQHFGPCAYWRSKRCNCVMAQIQAALVGPVSVETDK